MSSHTVEWSVLEVCAFVVVAADPDNAAVDSSDDLHRQ